MMYRPTTSNRDRAATITAVVLIHAGLAYAFLNLSGSLKAIEGQADLQIFDITDPPPPPVVEEIPEPEQAKPKEEEGAASARNIESKATPVVAPKPRIALPVPVPIPVTETPNTGNDPTQGASVPGPGTGAGGTGTGTGSGGAGSGTGGGGTGGQAAGPSVIRKLSNRDYPDAVIRSWPRGGRVFVRLRIQADGRASDCRVDRSSGVAAVDQWTCALIVERGRFRPAVDDNGRPIPSWYGYIQEDTGRMQRR